MKRLAAGAISLAVLAVIYIKIDFRGVVETLLGIDRWMFALSMLMLIPQTLVSAVRWRKMLEDHCRISVWKAAWLMLAGSSLNIVLPTKLGDFSKAYYHHNAGEVNLKTGLSLTVLEKALDLASLGTMIILGTVLSHGLDRVQEITAAIAVAIVIGSVALFVVDVRGLGLERFIGHIGVGRRVLGLVESWHEALESQTADARRLMGIVALSVLLWILHMAQIYLFFVALGSTAPLAAVFSLVPVAILVGLLPISFGGVGTRDAALIYLFAPFASASLMAGVGVLCTLRYFVPGIAGLPFVPRLGFKPSELEEKALHRTHIEGG